MIGQLRPILVFCVFAIGASCRNLEETSRLEAGPVSRSKLGLFSGFCHNLPAGSGCRKESAWELIATGKPRIVKILDQPQFAGEVKKRSPGTVVIARLYQELQPAPSSMPAKEAAKAWFSEFYESRIEPHGDVDYWEGYNEPDVGSHEKMQWYGEYEAERVRLLKIKGRKACIGNFSVGTPDIDHGAGRVDVWDAFLGALKAAAGASGILCLHEYSPKPVFQDSYFWYAGRYRQVTAFLRDRQLSGMKIAITEFGFDRGGNPDADGWQNAFSDPAEYMRQLAWYDGILREDQAVIGAAVYQHGIPGWKSFDLEPVMGRLTDHLKNQ